MLEIRHSVGRSGIDALQGEWQTLIERLPRRRHFHFPDWYRAYLEGYASHDGELHLFAAYDGATLVAILPLRYARERLFGLPLRHYSLVANDYIELADIVCDPAVAIDDVFAALTDYLGTNRALAWDMISFRHVLEESPILAADTAVFWRTCLRPHRGCYYHTLEQPYEAYFRSLSKNTRSSLKRARNKLSEAGGGTYLSTRDPAELPAYYEEFLEVEASGWKGAHGEGTAIKLNPPMDRFYRSLIESFGRTGRCEIQLLRLGQVAIAAQFTLLSDNTLYSLKISYREDHARLAPGHMLNELMLMHYSGCTKDIRYINLMTDPPSDRQWRPQRLQVSNLFAINRTPAGVLAYLRLRVRAGISRLYRGLRSPAAIHAVPVAQSADLPADPPFAGESPRRNSRRTTTSCWPLASLAAACGASSWLLVQCAEL
jgi:CelD/BcsL family acetyltransferase involved in cellulose biosynthesis